MNMPEEGIDVKNKPENLTDADKWILSKVNTLAKDVTENLDKFELGYRSRQNLRLYLGRIL